MDKDKCVAQYHVKNDNAEEMSATSDKSNRADSRSTATVIIAAPFVVNLELDIIVKGNRLDVKFESIEKINQDLHIFKGIVPITALAMGSQFKFIYVDKTINSHYELLLMIEYESEKQIQKEEILRDSWIFFVFKPSTKLFRRGLGVLKVKKCVASKFLTMLFQHTRQTVLSECDDDSKLWVNGLETIEKALGKQYSCDAYDDFLYQWIAEPNELKKLNCHCWFLLTFGAHHIKVRNFERMERFLKLRSAEFPLYLHNSGHLKRKDHFDVLELIANHGGCMFWWIYFRINRRYTTLSDANKQVSKSLLEILKGIPEVLLDDEECVTRVVHFLVTRNDIDWLFENLRPTFAKNDKHQLFIQYSLLSKYLSHKRTVDDLKKIIGSDFMKHFYQKSVDKKLFNEDIKTICHNLVRLSDVIRLAFDTPEYLLLIMEPIVESIVSKELKNNANFSKEEYEFFSSEMENVNFVQHFPRAKQQIEARLLQIAIDHVKKGSFQDVNSVKLILLALAEIKDTLFLEDSKIDHLKKAMGKYPKKFFQNLNTVLNNSGVSLNETLKPFSQGATRDIVMKVKRHFARLDKLLEGIKNRQVPLNEFSNLQNEPQVLDLLKNFGLDEQIQTDFFKEVEDLRERHKLYESLKFTFSHSARPVANHQNSENIQILDSIEWDKYLNNIDSEKSLLTLKKAMQLQPPLELRCARWLVAIKENLLFMGTVWHPRIKSLENYPLGNEDLEVLVGNCATEWKELASTVADGTVPFKKMDEIITLHPDPNLLSRNHLQPIDFLMKHVQTAYQNFKNVKKLRQLIGPFVAALQLFSIKQREPIDELYHFVENNLLKNWDGTTLEQVKKTGVLKVLEDLKFDPERPETGNAMQFVSSLVTSPTEGNRSPLIEWLRNKDENAMEAIGKILQGTLLEAYGQLQTLRTRIAPFLLEEFDTFHELLLQVRNSEERFVQRLSGRVQPINCLWLANMLPEIEAAVRASVISPSEDAKEKLAKIRQVVIEPKNETYSIEILLVPEGSLSMEELKQAFQLLDMAVIDDEHDRDDFVRRTRRNVEQIGHLSDVLGFLFASGCITYTFQERIVIELDDLDKELSRLRQQLEEWNNQWKEIEKMPLLALFSRGYLLQLVYLLSKNKTEDVISFLNILLPSAALKIEVNVVVQTIDAGSDCLSTADIFKTLQYLHALIEKAFDERTAELVQMDDSSLKFLHSYVEMLKSHFNLYTAVVILNVSREFLVASALVAYTSLTRQPIEPSRILFVTTHTDKQQVERFMKIWSVAKFIDQDIFIIVHVERLTADCANVVREGVDRVLPDRRAKLLLFAQHQHRVQSTKSLGARLGLVSDRLLDVHFTSEQLRQFFSIFLPKSEHLHFFTSQLPGCGKSQQAMRKASELNPTPDYYRICVRTGTVEELLASLQSIKNRSTNHEGAVFIHLDVAHSVSLEFNDILLSLLMYGALYDPKKAKLGFWKMSPQITVAVEFASPFGADQFPIIDYLGKHHICQCDKLNFTYELAVIPHFIGQPVTVNSSDALIVAGKFLQFKQEGLRAWDALCSHPDNITINPLRKDATFDLLVDSFQHIENRNAPTFTSLNAMASFLHRHIAVMIHSMWFNNSAVNLCENQNAPTFTSLNVMPSLLHRMAVMTQSMWFNNSAVNLFDSEDLARKFKLNIFELLLKVANDCITRCYSVVKYGSKLPEMDWIKRQRAMLLLGRSDMDVTGMNVVGRDANALKNMFDPTLLPFLQLQGLQFQQLDGFQNLVKSQEGTEVILNAMRSLLLLDGTTSSIDKVKQLDTHPKNTPAIQRLHEIIGEDQGYVLTGDNIMKMMFVLYRIRCGLPVVVFGETGVGKTALFRFLIQTFLGHTFEVCNVNSGTTIQDVEELVQLAIKIIEEKPQAQVFQFFDEMNTADPPVISFIKELMLDRHCHGSVLPENLHFIGAANPYRRLKKTDKEAAVGLAFNFALPTQNHYGPNADGRTDGRNLVYRVNELPIAFHDHLYDFGQLCDQAENTYIDEICHHGLPSFSHDDVQKFTEIIQKCHRVARASSVDPESAVSLRDATRAVQLLRWFCQSPAGKKLSRENVQKAQDLTIYLVYAFRFSERETFLENVFGKNQSASKNMAHVSKYIAKMLYEKAHGASIGSGAIALNDALCENLFALYVCVLNGIFLIIVGRPGSSKSLSVEILKLVLSSGNHKLRQELGDLPSLTELYFQCSPMSTSSGFKALFESAKRLSMDPRTMLPMVVLDELGLADISPEKPIKVLHSELERQSLLTSGEKQQSNYSVVALSNWIVDAAQVNRGILILRTQANRNDLLESAEQLADSLIDKFDKRINRDILTERLESIVDVYRELDGREDIGDGYFFSMRDFFFCVKNYVCSVLGPVHNISPDLLVQAAIRNFGGHEKARQVVNKIMIENVENLQIPEITSLDLIVKNILDSSKPESIHIARHLMILNRSLIGLQLLNRHVRNKWDEGTNWNVLFGSCFPGDLQVTAVTRKLRQVEQAIRAGGILVLCHADQLFESLYMVLNQQYWAQGDVTMTKIALGPSNRAIALPNGPFRVIALQDTGVALNRGLMSPAILSRFEKHELRPFHLLNGDGRNYLRVIQSHTVWLAVPEEIQRHRFIYGYHEESFVSLALHLQENNIPMDQDSKFENIWMPSINPMAMIKLECDSATNNSELQQVCLRYRKEFVLENLSDALRNSTSNRMIVMTNTLRHLQIIVPVQHCVIQIFEIQSELEFVRRLESINGQHLKDPGFCLIVQYDAVTGPMAQFQLAKYEVEQRFRNTKCRVVFIVHVDPRPVNMHWVFSFGDDWDYYFVDQVVRLLADEHQIALKELVQSPPDQPLSNFIETMSIESFKSLLFEMLGPDLQTQLVCLHSFLGQFYSGMRTALGLSNNRRLLELLKECLLAQLKDSSIIWNIVDAVSDSGFDSSSSLSNGLWGVFKQKICNSLAHLLLTSEAWRVADQWSMKLWCDFVDANYPDRLLSPGASNSIAQMPIGFRECTKPLGRLLASFKVTQNINEPLKWLLKRLSEDSPEMKQAYFLDWLLLCIHPHLHGCLKNVPLSKMSDLVDQLFEEPFEFFLEWKNWEAKVIAALELATIVSFATSDSDLWNSTNDINNWKFFTKDVARLSLTTLAKPNVIKSQGFITAISSIEVSSPLMNLLNGVGDLANIFLGLRTTKRILLFDPNSEVTTLPESLVSKPEQLLDYLSKLVINSVIRPRVASQGYLRYTNLSALLKSTSACNSLEELSKVLRECPTNNCIVLAEQNPVGAKCCSSCKQPLIETQHLQALKAQEIESLFGDYQKFMFFFERVAELFIQQRKNNPSDVKKIFLFLLSSDCRFRVSWRFLTVIVRTVLMCDDKNSMRTGKKTKKKTASEMIDELLLHIPCNEPTHKLNLNAHNLLVALLVYFDQDIEDDKNEDQDLIQAAMTDRWSVERIRKLAHIRRQLTLDENGMENVITKWSSWSKNQTDHSITNSLLLFILRFVSHEGDHTRLGNIFRNPVVAAELGRHRVIRDYIDTFSPLSLGIALQSADPTANHFQTLLFNGDLFGTGAFENYHLLVDLQPDWAPFIARLAYHAFDIFKAKKLSLLREMSSNLDAAAQFLLPGIENHPYLPSFTLESSRWYVCSCGQLCCLGNCGYPVIDSECFNCKAPLGLHGHHEPTELRQGVRRASALDFQPPKGMFVARKPTSTPNYAVRNCSPAVTRFALVLNSLALMKAALDSKITPQVISKFLLTLPPAERQKNEDRRSFIQLLSNHIIVHLDLLCQLLVTSRPQLNMTDKFRIGHLLLHKLLASPNPSFLIKATNFKKQVNEREAFERGLTELLNQQVNVTEELDHIAEQSDEASKVFRQSLLDNETSHWAYARRVFANRGTVQLQLARNVNLRAKFPFLNFLLDEDNGMRKLDALQHLGEAMRFIALVRTLLSDRITKEEANRMSIAQGLDRMAEMVAEKGIILDRGRAVTCRDDVMNLFDDFKKLWDRFSQLENADKKTFLDHFECQQVDINVRPKTVLEETAPLILICCSTEPPEAMFSCQLLSHAVEAASSIAQTNFIQPHCRKGSGPVRLSYSSAAALADFDESSYAHVSTEKVDRFIRDHVIDRDTLPLAESFAMSAILGSSGSTIAQDLTLDVISDFKFKDDTESGNFLAILERRFLAWQPTPIPPKIQELILADLEKNRGLAEARSVLISAITHLYSTTEPLVISKIRNNFLSDVLEELLKTKILTERHMSETTKNALNCHLKLEVRHVFGLLKAITIRTKGDVRVPDGWNSIMSESLAQQTRANLLAETGGEIVGTLLLLANNVADSDSILGSLMPEESLLLAIRVIEGAEWNGIPAELKMENLGHVLRIAECLPRI